MAAWGLSTGLSRSFGSVTGVTPGQQGGPDPMTGQNAGPSGVPEQEGSAEQVEKLNKHVTERTGDLNGPKATLSGR
jgi:hypothetical protein